MRFPVVLALAALALPSVTSARPAKTPGLVRVRIDTTDGPIVLALETKRAPKTSANFLAYVDDGRFDGTTFYRSARQKSDPKRGFIQAGIGTDARRILPPFPHEPTTKTGIHHVDGTISMARRADPSSAGGNYFITVGAIPSMDAQGTSLGYAAFGHVVSGMETVRHILAASTGGGSDSMRNQMILKPIRILSVKRLDGASKPTGRVKPWLIDRGDGKPK